MAFWGKGKAAGKGGKGKYAGGWNKGPSYKPAGWSAEPQWADNLEESTWPAQAWSGKGPETQQQSTNRIVNRYQLTTSVLRPSADKDGSVFVKKWQDER